MSLSSSSSRKTFSSSLLIAGLLGATLGLTGCPKPDKPPTTGGDLTAVTTIEPRSGSAISGSATFTQAGNNVRVHVEVKGATPGDHGIHVHETGDCTAPDAKSAGNHFNPSNAPHGGPGAAPHHGGDFGNLTVGPDGSASTDITIDGLTVGPGPNSVVGRALVLHEKPDDLSTQPSGNSGSRIGCGVIALKQ